MARYASEPTPHPAHAGRIGILLVNLGTPRAPTARAVRPFLRQFLSDPRVVGLPRWLWWPILNFGVLATRPTKSARKYASIWTKEGSPLKVHTERLVFGLTAALNRESLPGKEIDVGWAMRYGAPAIDTTLHALRARGCARLLVVPLYPQFAGSTTASTMDEVARTLQRLRNLPELRFVRSYPDAPGYIAALAASVREHWVAHGQGDCLVMSFHGQPQQTDAAGDPYRAECFVTAQRLTETLALPPEKVRVTFQSRFGNEAWLQPYTLPTLETLADSGLKRVDVLCPGFAADCLETLEEIAQFNRDAFLAHGGETFHAIPCLNERPDWIEALAGIVWEHLAGWV